MALVLVADDEPMVRDVLTQYLIEEGHEVITAENGIKAVSLVESRKPDLLILDVMLPGQDGYSVLAELGGSTPVLMLTARTETEDRLRGLELGADDYVTKPFSAREVVVRVRNILRRASSPVEEDVVPVITSGDVECDVARRVAKVGETELTLTVKEFDLLAYLVASPGVVFSRADLLAAVWDSSPEWQDPATVTVHMRRIRKKLEENPTEPKRLITVWGAGYRFEPWSG